MQGGWVRPPVWRRLETFLFGSCGAVVSPRFCTLERGLGSMRGDGGVPPAGNGVIARLATDNDTAGRNRVGSTPFLDPSAFPVWRASSTVHYIPTGMRTGNDAVPGPGSSMRRAVAAGGCLLPCRAHLVLFPVLPGPFSWILVVGARVGIPGTWWP